MNGLLRWPLDGLWRLALQPLGEFQVARVLALRGEQVGVVMFQRPGDQKDAASDKVVIAYRVYAAGARSRKEVPLHSQNAWHSTHLATENPCKSIEIAGVYTSAQLMHQSTQMREGFATL